MEVRECWIDTNYEIGTRVALDMETCVLKLVVIKNFELRWERENSYLAKLDR